MENKIERIIQLNDKIMFFSKVHPVIKDITDNLIISNLINKRFEKVKIKDNKLMRININNEGGFTCNYVACTLITRIFSYQEFQVNVKCFYYSNSYELHHIDKVTLEKDKRVIELTARELRLIKRKAYLLLTEESIQTNNRELLCN
jgi:hypothetical protein